MQGLGDRIVAIALGAVDVRNGVARRASNAGLSGRIIDIIVIRIIEFAAEEGHDIMAARTPARGFHIAVPRQGDFARLTNAKEIRRIIE